MANCPKSASWGSMTRNASRTPVSVNSRDTVRSAITFPCSDKSLTIQYFNGYLFRSTKNFCFSAFFLTYLSPFPLRSGG